MCFKKNNFYLFFIVLSIVLVPWDYFSPGRFEDLSTYRDYLYQNIRIEETIFNAPVIFLFKEIVFQKWLFFIYDFGFEIDTVIFIVALITIIIFFITLNRFHFDYRIALLLLCPLMIDFFNSQLRNSLAFVFFFWGYSFKNRIYKYILFIIATSFHLGITLLIVTYFIVNYLHSNISNKLIQFLTLLSFACLAAFGDKIFFAILDDPRIDVYSSASDMSIIYLLWAFVLFCILIHLKFKRISKLKELDFAIVGALLVVFCFFSGAYYGRYLAMFFPFILMSVEKFKIYSPVYLIVLFYTLYTFILNFVILTN